MYSNAPRIPPSPLRCLEAWRAGWLVINMQIIEKLQFLVSQTTKNRALERPWGRLWGVLGHLGQSWRVLGASWERLGGFWRRLEANLSRLGGFLRRLEGVLGALGKPQASF